MSDFYLKSIKMNNFRCYENQSFEFEKGINIIVGDNAIGKTSLVEAIYCFGTTKSFKSSYDKEMITKGTDYSCLKGEFCNGESHTEVMISYSSGKKKVIKNQKTISLLSNYVGFCGVVVFSPEDLDLIKGLPIKRRFFMDTVLTLLSKEYLNAATVYRKLLKQRNELLKNYEDNIEYSNKMLSILDKELVEKAVIIITKREKLFLELNPYINEKSKSISDERDLSKIEYKPNCSVEEIKTNYSDNRKNDILAKTTTWGPHRDDFIILINNEQGSIYSSQGQQKTAVLALKLGTKELLRQKYSNLMIILDDVFSDLDINRQNRLMKTIDRNEQIFITSVSIGELSDEILKNSNVINIKKRGGENEPRQ